jgi:hypothetical protein
MTRVVAVLGSDEQRLEVQREPLHQHVYGRFWLEGEGHS